MGSFLGRLASLWRAVFYGSILLLVQFSVLFCAYVRWYFRQLNLRVFGGRRIAKHELARVKRVPEHVAIVVDEQSDRFDERISETVEFAAQVPGVRHVSVFFRQGRHGIACKSEKVRTFQSADVPSAFKEAMLSKSQIESIVKPFDVKLDLVVIFSRTPSLCNFFPWLMDLATFVFAGPVTEISPLALVNAFESFESAEQRFGK